MYRSIFCETAGADRRDGPGAPRSGRMALARAWPPAPQGAVETTGAAKGPGVAVLPFVNLSGDANQEYFSDGLTEDILTELARTGDLRVLARNTTFQYKGKAVDVAKLGRELGVRYVLEGSVRRDGDNLRVTAQLIDAETGAHIWADKFDRKMADILLVQDEIVGKIVGRSPLARSQRPRSRRPRTRAPTKFSPTTLFFARTISVSLDA